MICPDCSRTYERREFGRDETYFECDDCATELLLSPRERAAEILRNGPGASAPDPALAVEHDTSRPSTAPLTIWIGLLSLYAIGGLFAGISSLAVGAVVPGFVVIAITLLVLGTPILGLVLRRRFGLYLSYPILVLMIMSSTTGLLVSRYRSGAELFGAFVAALLFVGAEVWIFVWLVRNRELFGVKAEPTRLVEDIYSPPGWRGDA